MKGENKITTTSFFVSIPIKFPICSAISKMKLQINTIKFIPFSLLDKNIYRDEIEANKINSMPIKLTPKINNINVDQ